MKKSLMLLFLVMLVGVLSFSASAAEPMADTANMGTAEKAKFCPICGPAEKMMGDEKFTHEYDGENYYFCSQVCLDTFKEDPEKYIMMMENNSYSEKESHDHNDAGEHEGHDQK